MTTVTRKPGVDVDDARLIPSSTRTGRTVDMVGHDWNDAAGNQGRRDTLTMTGNSVGLGFCSSLSWGVCPARPPWGR